MLAIYQWQCSTAPVVQHDDAAIYHFDAAILVAQPLCGS